ncbi:MAG: MurR/RpiR family transcriptional regulator [Rhizobiales bacterium]|nr:MurR/RpiR family transcriptional regulator [Hyphomicrobiales bacterium]
MDEAQLTTDLIENFDDLPPQLQSAARWVLDHPADVALLTTREQAKRAGLTPATLTRLAQRLGLSGYDALRQAFAASIRQRPDSFQGRAAELISRHDDTGDAVFVTDMFAALDAHLAALASPDSANRLTAAADLIAGAERVFCFGLRSAFPAAFMFDYIRALMGSVSVLADSAGGRGVDALRGIGPGDILFAVTVKPYTRLTLQAAEFAKARGAVIVALTDSMLSPLAKLAEAVVLVRTETPSFFHTMTPAFAAVECLAALVAARQGGGALRALADSESQLAAFDTYLNPRQQRPGRR